MKKRVILLSGVTLILCVALFVTQFFIGSLKHDITETQSYIAELRSSNNNLQEQINILQSELSFAKTEIEEIKK